jgi:L-ascorbate metabolism protein UlaG (beta-lactamase superfamily)
LRLTTKLSFRWLGVAGIELHADGRVLLVDPYLTRIRFWQLWLGRIRPDVELVQRNLQQCDDILVTHSHYDHLMDAPAVVAGTGASVFGSPNTCALMRVCGVPESLIHLVKPGDEMDLGAFHVTSLEEREHARLGGYAAGAIPQGLKPPLRADDFRMDYGLSYLIAVGGLQLLTETCLHPHGCLRPEDAMPVDVLFTGPYLGKAANESAYYRGVLERYRPKLVVPIHCDDMWQPLTRPAVGQLAPTGKVFPPLARYDRQRFKQLIEAIRPETHVFLPERLKFYNLDEIQGVS